MNRRQALSLMAALPWAARLQAQTRLTAQHRFALSLTHGLLIEPGGTLKVWFCNPGTVREEAAIDALGLGDNRIVDPRALYPVPGVTNVVAAAASPGKSFAVLGDGRVLAWGDTGSGDLGITPRAEYETRAQPRMRTSTPTPVAVPFDAVDISAKSDHVLARTRDGSVYAWGRGASGQLGIGPLPEVTFKTQSARAMPYVPYPVRIPDLQGVVAVAAGSIHSLALLQDGTVRAWGENKLGQVGDGTTMNRDRPTPVPGVRNVVGLAAGGYFSVAVLADGTVMEWGSTYGNPKPRPVPAPVAGARGIKSVVAGGGHVAALTQTGEVVTWGADAHYETGRGPRGGSAAGIVKGLSGVTSLAAAHSTTTAVLGSGRVMTWGEVRPWTRPDDGQSDLSPYPILLWLDGLDQP